MQPAAIEYLASKSVSVLIGSSVAGFGLFQVRGDCQVSYLSTKRLVEPQKSSLTLVLLGAMLSRGVTGIPPAGSSFPGRSREGLADRRLLL